MKRDGDSVNKSCLCAAILAISFSVGCGGSGSSSSGTPPITPVTIQGQYEVRVVSASNPNNVSVIETNFTQTGTDVSASKQNVVVLEGTLNSGLITLSSLGGECDSGVVGNDSIQGTFSNQTQASLSLTAPASLAPPQPP